MIRDRDDQRHSVVVVKENSVLFQVRMVHEADKNGQLYLPVKVRKAPEN